MTKTNDEIEIDSLFGDLAKEDDSLATFLIMILEKLKIGYQL